MPPDDNQYKEESQQSGQKGQGGSRKEHSTDQGQGNSSQCEPSDNPPIQFTPVEPYPTAISNQLGHRQDGYRLAHSEACHQDREQNSRPAKARDSGKSGGY